VDFQDGRFGEFWYDCCPTAIATVAIAVAIRHFHFRSFHSRIQSDFMSAPRPLLGRARGRQQQKSSGLAPSKGDDPAAPSSSGPREPRGVPTELVAVQDELDWLLDGLPSGSSFQGLLELLFSNQGRRLIIQVDTTAQSIIDRLAGMDPKSACYRDISARRAIACLLLVITMCGRLSCFTNETTVLLIKRIIDDAGSNSVNSDKKMDINLARFMGDQHVCRFVPREVSASPWCVCLSCLAYCVEPRENYDPSRIKESIGPLMDVLVSTVVEESGALSDANPTLKTVVALWKLKTSLLVLEQACFACAENQNVLNEKEVEVGCPPLEKVVCFNQFLVGLIRTLASHNRRLPSEGIKKDCFLLLISLLMNTTEGDSRACRDIQPEHLIACIGNLWDDSRVPHRGSSHTDELSALLGVMINVVDEIGCESICEERESLSELVTILCAMVTSEAREGVGDAGDGGVDVDEGSVTLESLEQRDAKQKGSSEAYGSILLGFLVVGSAEARELAEAQLKGRSGDGLDGIKASIERVLAFYLSVGALTPKTQARLTGLIDALAKI